MVDMGFPRNRVELALRRVGVNSIEVATEWLLAHPAAEEPPAAASAAASATAPSASDCVICVNVCMYVCVRVCVLITTRRIV